MEQPPSAKPRRSNRLVVGLGVIIVFVLVGGLAWTFTPSYSLYHIQRALDTHDYERFARYVDIDSVINHAADELGLKPPEPDEPVGGGSLADLVRQGLQALSDEFRSLVSAGTALVVEQVIRDRSRPLPAIPTLAIIGAIFVGETRDGARLFVIPLQGGEELEVSLRKSDAGVWRVVAVGNLTGLLAQLKDRYLDGRDAQ